MPAVNWPATLPQAPSSYSEKARSVVARTQPDSGPTKSRKRFTKAPKSASMSFLLTIAQRNALETFFDVDCAGGAVPMLFTHPWTGTQKEMYITEPPDYAADGPLGVAVSFKVEFF